MKLVLLMADITLPGIFLMVINEKKLIKDFLPDEKMPSFWSRFLSHLIMAVPFVILGIFFYSRAGFANLSFTGINGTSLLLSLVCALIHVAYYYGYFVRNVDKATIDRVEHSRKQLGILTRLFYGGIVEEVIFRFGLMSFFVWLGNLVIDNQLFSLWSGNLLAAILFALVHLPSIYQMKVKVTKTILIYSNSMNIMVGLVCGWLYWSEGLAASILCHMLFHLVWYFFEKTKKVAVPLSLEG